MNCKVCGFPIMQGDGFTHPSCAKPKPTPTLFESVTAVSDMNTMTPEEFARIYGPAMENAPVDHPFRGIAETKSDARVGTDPQPLTRADLEATREALRTMDAPHNSTPTSIEAAKSVRHKSAEAREALFVFVNDRGNYGATDAEIQRHFGWTGDFERPRRWELVNAKHIKNSTRTRKTEGQRCFQIVWVASWVRKGVAR
jgi:hypothetical protein